VVLDAEPWNPVHHAWFRFAVDHANDFISFDGGFEVYALGRADHHAWPPYTRSDCEDDGDWRWQVSDPQRKIVFNETFHIPLPPSVTVVAGNYVSSVCLYCNDGLTLHDRPSSLPGLGVAAVP
jgi:hypothetical protein